MGFENAHYNYFYEYVCESGVRRGTDMPIGGEKLCAEGDNLTLLLHVGRHAYSHGGRQSTIF